MKNSFKTLVACAFAVLTTGCNSFLDINENPNNPLTATADAILAQALSATATNYSVGNGAPGQTGFNAYASFAVGEVGKSGTVNGYQEERTYNYSSQFSQSLFNNTYDNLYDYELVEKQGLASNQPNHAAIARIMKVFNYQLLVDEYGDIPYSEALKGGDNTSPKYDKADAIYKDFIVKLNSAIALIQTNDGSTTIRNVGAEDIVFGGNMANWIRFANSLKLRILMRQSSASSLDTYVRDQMQRLQDSAAVNGGFITGDVQVQPGYVQSEGQQNPFWNRFRANAAGSSAVERLYVLPTKYILAQYSSNHDSRGTKIYRTTASGGYAGGVDLGETLPILGNLGTRFRDGGGVFKGLDAPTPLMLLADDLFTRSEAKSRGFFTGGDAAAKTDYMDGITASFAYFYQPASSQVGAASDSSAYVNRPVYVPTAADLAAVAGGTLTQANLNKKVRLQSGKVSRYLAANLTNPLVNWESGTISKQEKIIYQKYLAVNAVASVEAWDDYRRTTFPRFPASLQSISPRADKLPVRLLYPITEVTSNAANLPTGINQFTSKIFWDVLD